MKERKYHSVVVGDQCNVSSSFHYHWQVWYRDTSGKRYHRWYCYGIVDPMDFVAPKYLVREVERLIADNLEAETVVFFEYDRDGNKRFTDLRYHEPEWIPGMIAGLRSE